MLITRKKTFLILGEGPTQGLDDITLTAEKKYLINFTELRKKFCLSLLYSGANSYLLMAFKFIDMKQKNLKLMQFLYVQEKFQMIFLQAV